MGDKSPKSKQRAQKQKAAMKQTQQANARSKQDRYVHQPMSTPAPMPEQMPNKPGR